MKLYIKDKLLSARRNMHVLDEKGQPYLLIKGKLFSITHKRTIADLNGKPLFYVRRKFFHIMPKAFIYDANHNLYAKITKKFSIKQNFEIKGYCGNINVEGNIIAWHFSLIKDGKSIGTITKKFSAIVDSFELEVNHQEDAAFLVAFIAALDNIYDAK